MLRSEQRRTIFEKLAKKKQRSSPIEFRHEPPFTIFRKESLAALNLKRLVKVSRFLKFGPRPTNFPPPKPLPPLNLENIQEEKHGSS